MLVVIVRVFPSHLRILHVIEARNSAEIRSFSAKSEPRSVYRPIRVELCHWIGQLTDPCANRELASVMDRSADRSRCEQRVQKLTDRSADRSVSHWIGLPTDQCTPGSVGRPIQQHTEHYRLWIGQPTDPEPSSVPVSSWIDHGIDPTAQSIHGSIEMPDYS